MDETQSHTKSPHLGEVGFPIEGAMRVTGYSRIDLRNLIDRHKLLAGRGSGHGRRRIFSFDDLFAVCAVRALVEEGGLKIATAAAAVIPLNPIRWLYRGKTIDLAQDAAGCWDAPGPRACVRLVLDPMALYREMRPRFLELAPAETEAFDRFLAELREKRAAR